MEKGYPLWEPNDHKSFVWEVPPPVGGYLGAIQIAEEKMGPMPPMKIRIRWDDPDSCPIPRIYEHAIVASGIDPEGKVGAMILHEWEKSPTRNQDALHNALPWPRSSRPALRSGKRMTGRKYRHSQDSCPIFIDCGKLSRIRQSTGNAP